MGLDECHKANGEGEGVQRAATRWGCQDRAAGSLGTKDTAEGTNQTTWGLYLLCVLKLPK